MSSRGHFIMLHFDLLDSGCAGLLGPETLSLWIALRRCVWRESASTAHLANLSAAYTDGRLVCSRSQIELATMVGLARRTAQRKLEELRRLGWVRERGPLSARSSLLIYELGYLYKMDPRQERFYGEEWVAAAIEMLQRKANKKYGLGAKLTTAPIQERIAWLWEWDRYAERTATTSTGTKLALVK